MTERAASEQSAVRAPDRSLPTAEGTRKAAFGLAAALAVLVLVPLLPAAPGLTPAGQRTGAVFLAALVLWSTEALPIAVTALLAVILQPLLGVATVGTALQTFMSPVFFFVVAMFCVAAALTRSGLAERFARALLARAGADSRRVVWALVLGTGALSTIMADVPACAIFMAIALELFRKIGLAPGDSPFGKAVMMGIPIAALIGGVGTPAGSSVNILGLYFIERHGHVRVPFLAWTALGLPLVAVLVPFAAWVLLRVYPPERERLEELAHDAGRPQPPLRWAEAKALGILAVMIGLWVASTWYPRIDIVVVGVAGAVALFLPGVRLLTWSEAERSIGWDALFMIGGVTSLGAALVDTGLAKWMVDGALGGMQGWNVVAVLAVIGLFTVLIHLVLPIAPVVNAVLIPPIVLLAAGSGHHPALYALPVAFTASCAFLLPLDATALVTFSRGYYRMFDMLLPGAIISAAWVVVLTLLMVALGPALGFF